MGSYNILRHFMVDELSLRQYQISKILSKGMLMQNLLVCAHHTNPLIPDHYYEAWMNQSFKEAGCADSPCLEDYFTLLLPLFAASYFMLSANNEICVREDKWNEWQLVAREFSPSIMKVFFIFYKYSDDKSIPLDSIIEQNFRYTALPSCSNNILQSNRANLCDVHVHAGSSLEADLVWLNLLHDSNFFLSAKNNAKDDLKIHGIAQSRSEIYHKVLVARKLIDIMKDGMDCSEMEIENRLKDIHTKGCSGCVVYTWFLPNKYALQEEAKLLLNVLMNIREKKQLSHFLHYYLLIKGVLRNFLAVQSSQYGLNQFNQTLHAPYRGGAMDYLEQSLKQMLGNDLKGAKSVEIRVPASHLKNIDTIKDAVYSLHKVQVDTRKTTISLVCHFIKGEAKCIKKDCKLITKHLNQIAGVDVAGNDFRVSPAAFVNVFKCLREHSLAQHLHYTYHAGEDFYHLLDGLLVIYEAMDFLDLKEGDRIGHATAAGVDPNLWATNVGGRLPIAKGKYFDNLMFVKFLCVDMGLQLSQRTADKLDKSILELYPIFVEPINTVQDVQLDEWRSKRKASSSQRSTDSYMQIVEVGCFEIFTAEEIVRIQQLILKKLKEKGIAIEATPTSNVTIGHHHSFQSYHLLTWIKWKQQGIVVPDIVLGTDETGVFPINITNEYANVLELLMHDGGITNAQSEVETIMRTSCSRLFSNGHRYGVVGTH